MKVAHLVIETAFGDDERAARAHQQPPLPVHARAGTGAARRPAQCRRGRAHHPHQAGRDGRGDGRDRATRACRTASMRWRRGRCCGSAESVRGSRVHPREVPDRAQSRRKAEPGWRCAAAVRATHSAATPVVALRLHAARAGRLRATPGEHLQRRVGPIWDLTLRAGAPKSAGRCCAACPGMSLGCAPRLPQRPWPPRRGCIRLPLTL